MVLDWMCGWMPFHFLGMKIISHTQVVATIARWIPYEYSRGIGSIVSTAADLSFAPSRGYNSRSNPTMCIALKETNLKSSPWCHSYIIETNEDSLGLFVPIACPYKMYWLGGWKTFLHSCPKQVMRRWWYQNINLAINFLICYARWIFTFLCCIKENCILLTKSIIHRLSNGLLKSMIEHTYIRNKKYLVHHPQHTCGIKSPCKPYA